MLRTLEARGWAVRRADPADKRGVLISLTQSGRATIEHLFPRFNEEEAAVASVLDVEGQEQLAAMLRLLSRSVGDRGLPARP